MIKKINSLFDAKSIPEESQKILNDFDQIVQGVRPLNSRQLQQLPGNIREFAHQLTDDRASRRLGYMNENIQLSVYTRYYLWWNLVRQVRLFSNLDSKCFPENDGVCLDIGSGPLTVVTALWLARPELRKKKLTWYCLDVSQNSLKAGEDIFLSVVAKTNVTPSERAVTPNEKVVTPSEKVVTPSEAEGLPWKIIRIKGSVGTHINQKADFITAGNVMNEIAQSSDMPPEYYAKKILEQVKSYASQNAKYLFIEPGVPKSSRLLSLFRTRFLNEDYDVTSPCPHAGDCPMNGFKAYTGSQNKWCNFAFATNDAPKKLLKLSELSKLPKERAVLSFISAVPKTNTDTQSEPQNDTSSKNAPHSVPISKNTEQIRFRIASDPFRLPQHKTGFYACSSLGLSLIAAPEENNLMSGDLIDVSVKKNQLQTDEKSGAVKINL